MGAAKRDDNREVALIAQNILGTQPLFITGLSLTNATPLHVAVVDSNGDQLTSFGSVTKSATATLTNVSGSASSGTLLALNASRLGATIVNDSTAILYVKYGSTASSTSFSYQLQPGDILEVAFGYTGIITGIWASATGAARVTEFT